MLRPSKLFTSLQQVRHYLQVRIDKLVAVQQPVLQPTITQQASFQQAMQLIQVKNVPAQKAQLLQALHSHFPMVKVFSNPSVRRPGVGLWTGQQQFRSMMSGSTMGFRASPFRGPSVRSFSTTKAPCVFQPTSPFAPLSRLFTPTKMPSGADGPSKASSPMSVPNQGMMQVVSLTDCPNVVHATHPSSPKVFLSQEQDILLTLTRDTRHAVHSRLPLDWQPDHDGKEDLVKRLEKQHQSYSVHMQHLFALLKRLKPWLGSTVRLKLEKHTLFLLFPTFTTVDQAGHFLKTRFLETKEKVDLDYFQDLQQLIQQIDHLIDHGPAFTRKK
ncbi:hypothetical protein BY458DRAFT_520946 [Sporodiniella umbellata]|nr:hypothetical protein BY458DRAFT_520946 [Sporodiniella umbellata]